MKLILNLVSKYIARYLELDETNFSDISKGVQDTLRNRGCEDFEIFQQMFTNSPGVTDIFAIQCLADLRSTAAIVKEIIFKGINPKSREVAINHDFGSGSEILMLAAYIHSKRNKF